MQREDRADRSKAELDYVGMGSVFTASFKPAFAHLSRASQSAIATIFRHGIDSDFFPLVFVAAMWVVPTAEPES